MAFFLYIYKATITVIAVTIPANIFFSSQVSDIRQLLIKFFDIIKFLKIVFKSKDIVNHFFTFTFLKKLITRFKIILFTHSFFCLCQTFDPLAESRSWSRIFKSSSNVNCAKSQIRSMSLKSTAILQIAQYAFVPKQSSQP